MCLKQLKLLFSFLKLAINKKLKIMIDNFNIYQISKTSLLPDNLNIEIIQQYSHISLQLHSKTETIQGKFIPDNGKNNYIEN